MIFEDDMDWQSMKTEERTRPISSGEKAKILGSEDLSVRKTISDFCAGPRSLRDRFWAESYTVLRERGGWGGWDMVFEEKEA